VGGWAGLGGVGLSRRSRNCFIKYLKGEQNGDADPGGGIQTKSPASGVGAFLPREGSFIGFRCARVIWAGRERSGSERRCCAFTKGGFSTDLASGVSSRHRGHEEMQEI